jgi:membrane-associated protease RseP (regulator of RpoE activity)
VTGDILAAPTPAAGEGQAWLGIGVADITDRLIERLKLTQKTGVVVTSVTAKSPAAEAGVKTGDVVTAVNGVAVKTAQELITEVRKGKPGDVVTLSIVRGNENLVIKVTAGTAPQRILPNLRPNVKPTPAVPPDLKGLQGLTPEERFSNNYGSTHTYKDSDGSIKTVYSIPGTVTAISATSITITPNNPQSRGGPFIIDGTTRITVGGRRTGSDAIAVNDKVIVVVVGDSAHATAISTVSTQTQQRQFRLPLGDRWFKFELPQRNFRLPGDLFQPAQPQQPSTGTTS